jgi:phage terminase large subunit-like protein
MPTMAEACGSWFREIIEVLFGARDPVTNVRYVEEIFALVAKKNSKTTYGAGLMLTACRRVGN